MRGGEGGKGGKEGRRGASEGVRERVREGGKVKLNVIATINWPTCVCYSNLLPSYSLPTPLLLPSYFPPTPSLPCTICRWVGERAKEMERWRYVRGGEGTLLNWVRGRRGERCLERNAWRKRGRNERKRERERKGRCRKRRMRSELIDEISRERVDYV